MSKPGSFVALAVLAAMFIWSADARGLDIVKDGKAVAVIVTPDQPDGVTVEAARLLTHYVKECTGAELAVMTESALAIKDRAGATIFVGHTKAAQALGLKTDALAGDSYFMRVKDGALYLVGRDLPIVFVQDSDFGARGTMRAVFDFLRDHAGVRWVLPVPKGDWTPAQKNLVVPDDLKVDYVPNMLYATRRLDRFYPWSLANGARNAIRLYTAGGHSWCYAVPNLEELRAEPDLGDKADRFDMAISTFARENPEAFALAGGRRLNRPSDYGGNHNLDVEYAPYLCTSHPDFVPNMTKWIQQKFDQGFEVVQLGQSDGMPPSKMCHCDRCNRLFGDLPEAPALPKDATPEQKAKARKFDDDLKITHVQEIGNRLLIPHKAVIENCMKSHPNMFVMLSAYQAPGRYLTAEKDFGMRFPPNTIIEAASADPTVLDRLKRSFPDQKTYGHWWNATLYDYWWSPYHGGIAPNQSPETIAAQQRKLLQYRMLGNYFCGGAENFAANGPCYYVCLRTMEQPNVTPQELLREYCAGLYGQAAPTMVAYYNGLYEKVRGGEPGSGTASLAGYGENIETRHRMKYLTCWPLEKLAQLDALLKKAETESAGDERARNFIRLARIGYEQVYFTSVVFHDYDALEKSPTPDGPKKVQAALEARQSWIKRMRSLKETEPAFVRDYFPNYKIYVQFLDDEECRQSPLGKPFKGWEGPVAPNPD